MDSQSLQSLVLEFNSLIELETKNKLFDDEFFKNYLVETIRGDNDASSADNLVSDELEQSNTYLCRQLKHAKEELASCLVKLSGPVTSELEKGRKVTQGVAQEISSTLTHVKKKIALVESMRLLKCQLRRASVNLSNVSVLNDSLKQTIKDTRLKYGDLENDLCLNQLHAAPLYTNIPSNVYNHQEFGVQCTLPYTRNKKVQVPCCHGTRKSSMPPKIVQLLCRNSK